MHFNKFIKIKWEYKIAIVFSTVSIIFRVQSTFMQIAVASLEMIHGKKEENLI